jgi:CheY-like chemotaxis protein
MSGPGRNRGLSGPLAHTDRTKVPQTLLLADDSVTIQRVIELTFADQDIDVVAVSDGDQAIARLDAMPPDIVLVDVGMPGKSGYEVAAYMKQSPRLSHIPVVLLTGAFEPVDEALAAGAGCDGVLAKPFEPQLVIGRVRELLDASSRRPMRSDADTVGVSPAVAEAPPDDESGSIDDYFDQLDAAFSNLSAKPARPAPVATPEIDWFGLKHGSSASIAEPELAMHQAAPEPATERAEPAPEPVWARAVPPMPASPPPLSDEFAALLEAEEAKPPSTAPESSRVPAAGVSAAPVPAAEVPAPEVPAAVVPAAVVPAAAPAAAPVAVTDDLVAQVSARVLLQLTDRVVRETVAEIAERLVREEIERIKASIQ